MVGKEEMTDSQKGYRIIAEVSVIPIGTKKTSLSSYVAIAVKALESVENLKVELTPMGSILESESLATIFEGIEVAHQALFEKGIQRIISTIHLDDRRDKTRTMTDKTKAVNKLQQFQ